MEKQGLQCARILKLCFNSQFGEMELDCRFIHLQETLESEEGEERWDMDE